MSYELLKRVLSSDISKLVDIMMERRWFRRTLLSAIMAASVASIYGSCALIENSTRESRIEYMTNSLLDAERGETKIPYYVWNDERLLRGVVRREIPVSHSLSPSEIGESISTYMEVLHALNPDPLIHKGEVTIKYPELDGVPGLGD